MVSFVQGRAVKTAEPTVTVDAGLPLGTHRFQLVVLTDTGQQSAPAFASVAVVRIVTEPLNPTLSTGVLSPVTPLDTTLVRPRGQAEDAPRTTPRARPATKPATQPATKPGTQAPASPPAKPRKPRKAP